MGDGFLSKAVPLAAAAAALVAIAGWVTIRPKIPPILERVPGQDNVGLVATTAPTDLRGTFTAGSGKPAIDLPGAWPQFRGANHDNISRESIPLARQWKGGSPRKLWSIELGEGYAGPAVLNGRVYVLDYDAKKRADVLRCLSLADGSEIWNRSYAVDVPWFHGMSRTVPAVTDKYVVTLGPKCHVLCCDAVSGDFKWGIDLVHEYKTKVPQWYAGQCPLIDNGRVILAPGRDALMTAVDLESGNVIWKTPNPHRWDMTHSSIAIATYKGRRMYVYCATGGVAGISAEDGSVLWETTEWKPSPNVPVPVQVAEDRILLTGYVLGSMMLQLSDADGRMAVRPVYTRTNKVFGSDQHTPILYNGYLYSVIATGRLVCMGLDGKTAWTSGEQQYGLGPFIIADGMLIVLNDAGVLSLIEARETGYMPIAQSALFDKGRDAWGPLALVGGRLIVRDMTRMVCLDMRKASYE